MLEQAGVAGERPSWSVRLALEAAQHRLRHGDHVGDLLCPVEQPGVERRREPAQHRRYAAWRSAADPRVSSGGPATFSRCTPSSQGADISAMCSWTSMWHQSASGSPSPVRQQHRHLAAPLPSRGSPSRRATVEVRPSAPMTQRASTRSPLRRTTPRTGSSGEAGPDQVVHLAAGPKLRARLHGGLYEHCVQRDPPDRHGPVVAADRRECSGHSVTQDPPAVLDRTQHVGGAEPVTRAELIEQVQRVREQLVRRDGVAGKGFAVHQQHPLTGAREQRGHGRAGAAGADHHRVVLLVSALSRRPPSC